MNRLHGTGVALITPFRTDTSVDEPALRRVVTQCIEGGVDYLVVLGTTAEVVTLRPAEKEQVLRIVISENAGKLPLVIGIGGNDTMQVAEALGAMDLEPFEAILSVSPYYNKPTQEGIYRHFKYLAGHTDKPLILYNVPSRTGSNILPETVVRLARDCKNIIGIKEASGDMEQISMIIESAPEGFEVISGDDFTALSTIKAGGVGVISVLGQGLPVAYSYMIRMALEGNLGKAEAIEKELIPGMDLIFREGNPAGIKAIFEFLGISGASVRLPLVEASANLKNQIAGFMNSFSGIHA